MDFPALITFLSELALNNNKPWFEEHRPAYEQLRGEWLAFVGQVIDGISQFDPSVGIVSPKDALFRINRDVRFSKDKRPYKTTFSAAICPQGRSSGLPAYYFQIDEAGALFIGGGVWMPEPTILGQIRQHIAEHPERLSAVLADPGFRGHLRDDRRGAAQAAAPGLRRNDAGHRVHQAQELHRRHRAEGWLVRADDLADEIVVAFRAMFPLIGWLRAALTGSSDLGYLSPQEIDRLPGSGSQQR